MAKAKCDCDCKCKVWTVRWTDPKRGTEDIHADACLVKPEGLLFFEALDGPVNRYNPNNPSGLILRRAIASGEWASVTKKER